jgi:ATP-dependent helicase HrpA
MFWQRYVRTRAGHDQLSVYDPQLELFRWMLEEYRVSLFAQPLGTSIKVSPERLDKQWRKVKACGEDHA